MSPQLPNELLQEILQISARFSTDDTFRLLTLSKWVYEWLCPILFEIVVMRESHAYYRPPHLKTEAASIFQNQGKHVRALMIDMSHASPTTIASYLESCPNVTNLALCHSNITQEQVDILQKMPLRRLSIYSSKSIVTGTAFDLSSCAFQTLTRLDLIHAYKWESWEVLAKMPCLTHLALDHLRPENHIMRPALENCKQLRVLVLVSLDSSEEIKPARYAVDRTDDRVVSLSCPFLSNWLWGAEGKKDMWEFAEEVVAARD